MSENGQWASPPGLRAEPESDTTVAVLSGLPAATEAGNPLTNDEIGLNAARIYGVDPTATRCRVQQSELGQLEPAPLLLSGAGWVVAPSSVFGFPLNCRPRPSPIPTCAERSPSYVL
jgi:hypothetical protein